MADQSPYLAGLLLAKLGLRFVHLGWYAGLHIKMP